MSRAEWYAKYREWRVQDRVWHEMSRARNWKCGDGVPTFVTWPPHLFSSTRLWGDVLREFPMRKVGFRPIRMNHLRKRARLP